MPDKKFLHLYLQDAPEDTEIQTLLEFYGFTSIKFVDNAGKSDPNESHWSWNHPPLSNSGFKLIHFDGLFKDDLHYGDYGAFVILEGSDSCSRVDLSYIDVITKFLIDRYGGMIHNPNSIGQARYLCGASS